MVGLTAWSAMFTAGGVDGGGGGGACRAGSTISPASLEKSRSGAADLRAARVTRTRGVVGDGVAAAAVPLANGVAAAVADPVAGGGEAARAEDDGPAPVEEEGPATGGMAASATGTQSENPGAMFGHGRWYGATAWPELQDAGTVTAAWVGATGADAP